MNNRFNLNDSFLIFHLPINYNSHEISLAIYPRLRKISNLSETAETNVVKK